MPFDSNPNYRTAAELCRAIALTWLSAGGIFGRELMLDFFADFTDEELANDAIGCLGLDCRELSSGSTDPCTWMEERGITHEDIEAAFAWLPG